MLRQCVVIAAPRRIEVAEELLPRGQPGQLLVRTEVSAISPGTEMLFYRGQVPEGMALDATLDPTLDAMAQRAGQYPLRYGYSCVGRVVEVAGESLTPWLHRRVFAFVPHASHFWVDPGEVLLVPEGLDPAAAALLPNMETAVNFVMDGQPAIGEQVVVVGQGVVGLLTTALLRQFPLQRLTAVDPIELRRATALRLGADSAIFDEDLGRSGAPPPGWEPADLVYELSGNPAALNTALALTGFAGRVVIGSWYGQKQAPLNLGGAFHRSRIRLIASQVSTIDPQWRGRWDKDRRFALAWRMLQELQVGFLITHRFPVAEAAGAYRLIDEQPEQAIQVVLTYAQDESTQTTFQ